MSSHYESSHYGGSHYASSHYGRAGQIVVPFSGAGIMDAMPTIRKKRGVIQRNIRHLLLLSSIFISITQEEEYERREEDETE